MTRKRGAVLALVALTAALTLAACSSSADTSTPASPTKTKASTATGALKDIQDAGVLKVGMAANPPFSIQDTDGTYGSFSPAFMKYIAKKLGVKLELVSTTTTTMIAGLQTNQFDMIGIAISATPERKTAIDFSTPYAKYGNSWIVEKSSKITTIKQLNNAENTIAYNASTFQQTATASYLPLAKTRSLTNASYADLISEVTSGNATAIALPSLVASVVPAKFPALRTVPGTVAGVEPTDVGLGVAKNQPDLLAALDTIVKGAVKDGEIDALMKKYITQDKILP
jgi:polar amino acid transport system substrate-binding protein